MSRLKAVLPVFAAVLLPLPVGAAPFSGLSAGLGGAGYSLDVQARFGSDSSTHSETAHTTGALLDLGFGFLPSPNVHLQAGVRAYPIEMKAHLEDCFMIDQHVAAYGQVGYVFDTSNMVYASFESGTADANPDTEDYPEFSADTIAFGIGYKRALSTYLEVFVEGVNRTYGNISVRYDDGRYSDADKDVELASTNVAAGFLLRF